MGQNRIKFLSGEIKIFGNKLQYYLNLKNTTTQFTPL